MAKGWPDRVRHLLQLAKNSPNPRIVLSKHFPVGAKLMMRMESLGGEGIPPHFTFHSRADRALGIHIIHHLRAGRVLTRAAASPSTL